MSNKNVDKNNKNKIISIVAISISMIIMISLIFGIIFKYSRFNPENKSNVTNSFTIGKENENNVKQKIDLFLEQKTKKEISSLITARNIDVYMFVEKEENCLAKILAYENTSSNASLSYYLNYFDSNGNGAAYFKNETKEETYYINYGYGNTPEEKFKINTSSSTNNNINIFKYLIENKKNLKQEKDNIMYLYNLDDKFKDCLKLYCQYKTPSYNYFEPTKLALYVDEDGLLNIIVYANNTKDNLKNQKVSKLKFYGGEFKKQDPLQNNKNIKSYRGMFDLNTQIIKKVKELDSSYIGYTKIEIPIDERILKTTTPLEKIYDGKTNIDVELDQEYINKNIKTNERFFLEVVAKANFEDKDVSEDKNIIYKFSLKGLGSEYYELKPTVDFIKKGSIKQKEIVFNSNFNEETLVKEYDGTNNAVVKFINNNNKIKVPSSQIIEGDEVEYMINNAYYEDSNAGNDKNITVELNLSGSNNMNYKIKNKNVNIKGNITKRQFIFNLVANERSYIKGNLNVDITVETEDPLLNGVVTASGIMEDDKAGIDKSVTVELSGFNKENYSYIIPEVKVNITKAKINYELIAESREVEDGNNKVVLKANVLNLPEGVSIIDGEGTVEDPMSTLEQEVTIVRLPCLDNESDENYELNRTNEGIIKVTLQ